MRGTSVDVNGSPKVLLSTLSAPVHVESLEMTVGGLVRGRIEIQDPTLGGPIETTLCYVDTRALAKWRAVSPDEPKGSLVAMIGKRKVSLRTILVRPNASSRGGYDIEALSGPFENGNILVGGE